MSDKQNAKSLPGTMPKLIFNSIIDNYSLKDVISNVYEHQVKEFHGIESPLLALKQKYDLGYITNLIFDFRDKLTQNDIKDIDDLDNKYDYLLIKRKLSNKYLKEINNLSPMKSKNKSDNHNNNENLENNSDKNEYTSRLRSSNKKELELKEDNDKNNNNNHSKKKEKKEKKEKLIKKKKDKKMDKKEKEERVKSIGFKKRFSKKLLNINNKIAFKYIKENETLLKNIDQSELPKGLILESTEGIDESNVDNCVLNDDEIFMEEEYSRNKKFFSKNKKLDSETISLQNRILGKDIKLGNHFNRNENNDLYLYNITNYGKNGLIKMRCSNQSCRASALYNYITKVFYLVNKHSISLENHKMRNTPSFQALDYVTYLDRHFEFTDLQIYKVPKDKISIINRISFILEKELEHENAIKNNNNEYSFTYPKQGNEEEKESEEFKENNNDNN